MMLSRRIAGYCRRVLVVVLVSVLLVSACSPAFEEGDGGSSGAGTEVPDSSASSVAVQRALDVLEGVFTGEELEDLQEVFTEEELVDLAGQCSGEELVGLLGPESAEAAASEFLTEDIKRLLESIDEGGFESSSGSEVLSDGELRARAFLSRAVLGSDPLGIDENDVSTPVGAFCWVVLRLRWVLPSRSTVDSWWFGGDPDMEWWYMDSFYSWRIEREVNGRGLELGWETGPVGYNRSLRRLLLQATDPKVRDVVFSAGLPAVLRPVAESLYDYFDGLSELPVYRVRPKVEEISGYPALAGMTGEDIRRFWPEILELKLSRVDYDEYLELFQRLEEDEVRGLLNAECKQRTLRERLERACPSWVAEVFSETLIVFSPSDGILSFACTVAIDVPRYWGSNSDCLFGCSWEASRERPPDQRLAKGFGSVSAGLDYVCGVRRSGAVWCRDWWGSSTGDWDSDYALSGSDLRFRSADVGSYLGCGILRDLRKGERERELYCWREKTPLEEWEQPPEGKFSEVSVGIEHACAIRVGGELACWGIDPEDSKVSPPAGEFVSVDAGWDGDVHLPEGDTLGDGGFSCGLRADAAVECWGEENLTYGVGSERGDEFAGVAVGRDGRICVLRTDGVIHCGKDRVYGSDYPPGGRFTQVSVGGLNHICGLRTNGSIECWNSSGEFLGNIPGPFTEIEVGYTYANTPLACGLLEDKLYQNFLRLYKRIVCWDLKEEVFKWAAAGLEEYKHPQCFLDTPAVTCWTAGVDPPHETDTSEVESPILLPHSGSVLYPDRDSG